MENSAGNQERYTSISSICNAFSQNLVGLTPGHTNKSWQASVDSGIKSYV